MEGSRLTIYAVCLAVYFGALGMGTMLFFQKWVNVDRKDVQWIAYGWIIALMILVFGVLIGYGIFDGMATGLMGA